MADTLLYVRRMSTSPLNEAVMRSLLRGSNWIGQPTDYSHCVALAFRTEDEAHVTLGFGQTLYFVATCSYELLTTTTLRLTYDSAPERVPPSFAFTQGSTLTISVTLESGDFSGTENIVNWPFTYFWRLRCDRHPFPDGVPFPRSIPTDFYGYKQQIPDATPNEQCAP